MAGRSTTVLFLLAAAAAFAGGAALLAQTQLRSSRFLFSDPLILPAQLPDAGGAVKRTRYAEVNLALLAESAAETPVTAARLVELNLFPDTFLIGLLDRAESTAPGRFSWIGRVSGLEPSAVTLVVYNGVLAGNVQTPTASYQIRYAGGALYAIQEVDPDQLAPEAPPIPVPPGGEAAPADTAPDGGDVFDLLVVYTPAARAAAGGTNAINAEINLGVSDTNTAYANSGIVPRLRLVGTAEVSYAQATDMAIDLQRLQQTSDGFMDQVHAWRNSVGADLVKLIVQVTNYCGVAYLMGGLDPGFDRWAFSVTARECISGYTFAHELGHNMGCNHAPDDPVGQGAFSYSFGYKDPGFFRTVMAYACTGTSCPRILQFSSPVRSYNGRVTGTPSQDNARSINNARLTIANWRQAVGVTAPGAPSNLTATVSGSTVTFSWAAATTGGTPTTYVLEAGSSSGASNLANFATGSTATSYTATGVLAGTYYARVRARNSAGTSAASNEVRVVVGQASSPGAPSNLTATVSGSTVTLAWTAPTSGGAPTSYVLEAGSSPGASNLANFATGNTATSYMATGVPVGTYYVRVRARNSAGTSGPSNETTVVVR